MVIDKLVATIREPSPTKRQCVISLVHKKLSAPPPDAALQTLMHPNHEWLLLPADLQRAPYVPPPEQGVEQWVVHAKHGMNDNDEVIPALTRITNALPIMAAPNPMTKQALKLTKCTYSSRMQNNIPGSVPPIMSANRCPFKLPPSILPPTLQGSPQMSTTGITPGPTRLPHVHFVPIEGGVQQQNMILLETINFLTKCAWENLQDTYSPTKLTSKSAPSCLDLAQVAMLRVHPTTGETISSYKQLMHDPATSEVWQMAFGKDFGGMV